MLLLVPVAGLEPARLAAGAFETPMSTIPTHWHLFIKWCDRLDLNQGFLRVGQALSCGALTAAAS